MIRERFALSIVVLSSTIIFNLPVTGAESEEAEVSTLSHRYTETSGEASSEFSSPGQKRGVAAASGKFKRYNRKYNRGNCVEPSNVLTPGKLRSVWYKQLSYQINCQSKFPEVQTEAVLDRIPSGMCCGYDHSFDEEGGWLLKTKRYFSKKLAANKRDNVECWDKHMNQRGGACKTAEHDSCERAGKRWLTWIDGKKNGRTVKILTGAKFGDRFAYGYAEETEDSKWTWTPTDYNGMIGAKWLATTEPTCPMRTASPLIVDMGNTGVELTPQWRGVDFDLAAIGKKQRLSWPVDSRSMFLVLDKSGPGNIGEPNGKIDDGNELFGNFTKGPDGKYADNGFLALAKYDSNHDGKIDEADPIFNKLRLWSDKNMNGISEPDELISLKDAGVRSISLGYKHLGKIDSYGNAKMQVGALTLTNGETRKIYDVWFDTESYSPAEIPKELSFYDKFRQMLSGVSTFLGFNKEVR